VERGRKILRDGTKPTPTRAFTLGKALLWRLKLTLQPAGGPAGSQWIRTVAVEALERTLALATLRQRQDQISPAGGASRSFSLAHNGKNIRSQSLKVSPVADKIKARIFAGVGNIFPMRRDTPG
jgi:hypothetical protein